MPTPRQEKVQKKKKLHNELYDTGKDAENLWKGAHRAKWTLPHVPLTLRCLSISVAAFMREIVLWKAQIDKTRLSTDIHTQRTPQTKTQMNTDKEAHRSQSVGIRSFEQGQKSRTNVNRIKKKNFWLKMLTRIQIQQRQQR